MEHEKADQEQALAWLRENSNPDARPGTKRHKKCLLEEKRKKTTHHKNKPHSLKRKWGNYTKEEGNNSCVNTGCLPHLRF